MKNKVVSPKTFYRIPGSNLSIFSNGLPKRSQKCWLCLSTSATITSDLQPRKFNNSKSHKGSDLLLWSRPLRDLYWTATQEKSCTFLCIYYMLEGKCLHFQLNQVAATVKCLKWEQWNTSQHLFSWKCCLPIVKNDLISLNSSHHSL